MKDLLTKSVKTISGLLIPLIVFFLSRELGFYLYIKSMIESGERENVNTLAMHSEIIYQLYVNFHPLTNYLIANEICSMIMRVQEDNDKYINSLIFATSPRLAAYEIVNPVYTIARIANNQDAKEIIRIMSESDQNQEFLRSEYLY